MAIQTNLFEDAIAETIELHRDMTSAYIGYARETITDRALPDVRDGLKPVQRRILFAMKELGLTHDKPHKKSARIVGEVLGKYHPHGDSSVYLAMVRMAQQWIMSAPLVDGQGNFGSIDGDSPAAMRYTEARLTAVADATLQDLHMDTVSWVDNFDGSLQEPTVLPSVLPNLLINGADGIAVGMATKIPPHNLGEVCDAVNFVAGNWKKRDKIGVDELMQYIPGPDFPTGGILYRFRKDIDGNTEDTIRQAYVTGRGRVIMQARLSIEDIGGGKKNIVVNELPYAVLKTTVIEKLAKEIRDGRITGVTDLRDESDYTGMRVVIELSRNADPEETLQDIMKYSQLRETFGIINLALVPGEGDLTRPEYLSLRSMLTLFIDHRLEVIERRSRFELDRRKARLHIVEGLLKALDILDEVIDTIRHSRTADTARTNLERKFGFTEIQATAILDMQLRRLAALERQKLVDEQKELAARIKYLEGLLASEAKRLGVVIEETTELKENFAIPRRTIILDAEDSAAGKGTVTTQADLLLPDDPQMIILTPNGIERKEAKGFRYSVSEGLSSRTPVGGGHLYHLRAQPADTILLISNKGRAWKGGVGFVPESATFEMIGLARDETVIGAAVIQEAMYLVMVSQSGKIKRTKIEDISLPERTWDVVFGLSDDDSLIMGDILPEHAQVIFYTAEGQLLRIDGDTINPQQTGSASGMVGVKVQEKDKLLGAYGVPGDEKTIAEQQVIVTSEKGYVHKVPLSEFALKGRGGIGVRALRITDATGKVGGINVGTGKYLDVFLEDGRRQRIAVDDVPATARDTRGQLMIEDPQQSPVTKTVML